MRWAFISLTLLAALGGLFSYNFLTIFVVRPIDGEPPGASIVVWQKPSMNFIDSPDAICDRRKGEVNLACRQAAMKSTMDNNSVLVRLGYSDWLYEVSTGGKRWER